MSYTSELRKRLRDLDREITDKQCQRALIINEMQMVCPHPSKQVAESNGRYLDRVCLDCGYHERLDIDEPWHVLKGAERVTDERGVIELELL